MLSGGRSLLRLWLSWRECFACRLVLAGNSLLCPLVNYINPRPLDARTAATQYMIHATCRPGNVPDIRDLLFDTLEAVHYPVREVDVLTESEDLMELGATLVASSAETRELDGVVTVLEASPFVGSATWTVNTMTT